MAKWRPIDVRLWSDRKFLSLGDEAKLLWIHLLTSPSTLSIPGVIIAGEAAIAELLEWSPQRFRERFAEIVKVGLSVRREGRLIWLPNALKYQPPSNPNAVKSWAKCWDDVPEGALKIELWQTLKTACKSWNGLFAKGFPQPLHDGSANGSRNGSTQDQEQDQEQKQEQEQDQDLYAGSRPQGAPSLVLDLPQPPKAKRFAATPDLQRVIDAFHVAYRAANGGAKPTWGPKQAAQLKTLIAKHGGDEVIRRIGVLASAPPVFLRGSSWDVGTLVVHFDKLASAAVERTTQSTRNNPTETALKALHEARAREGRTGPSDPFGDMPHPSEAA